MEPTVSTVPVCVCVREYLWTKMVRGSFPEEVGLHQGLQRWVRFEWVTSLGGGCFKWEKENEQKQKGISSV